MEGFDGNFKVKYKPVTSSSNKKPIKRALQFQLKELKQKLKSSSKDEHLRNRHNISTSKKKKTEKKCSSGHHFSREQASSRKKKITVKKKKVKTDEYLSIPIKSSKNFYADMLEPMKKSCSTTHLPLIVEQIPFK